MTDDRSVRNTILPSLLLRFLPLGWSAGHRSHSHTLPQTPATLHLRADELMYLTKASGVRRIEVRQGLIWLTGTPANGDVLLQAGDVFHLSDCWPFLIQALDSAEISVMK
jgi:hypothetical protein